MDLTRVVNNFIEEADCLAIISHLEQLISTGDVTVRADGRVGVINRPDETFKPLIKKYKNKTIKMFNDEFKYFSGYIATKYVPGVGMATHIDSQVGEEMGVLMYLNDDYEGGELTYTDPEGNEQTIKPKTGDMVYCPSWYPHGVNKVTSGTRYFFTISLLNHQI
jgi:predicted 2-oxoglutarate/Fe(II)-dependent dioxygenase YbiX